MELSNDVKEHERRISRIDGVLETVATKEDLAKLENRLIETFRQSLEQVRDEIKAARRQRIGLLRSLK